MAAWSALACCRGNWKPSGTAMTSPPRGTMMEATSNKYSGPESLLPRRSPKPQTPKQDSQPEKNQHHHPPSSPCRAKATAILRECGLLSVATRGGTSTDAHKILQPFTSALLTSGFQIRALPAPRRREEDHGEDLHRFVRPICLDRCTQKLTSSRPVQHIGLYPSQGGPHPRQPHCRAPQAGAACPPSRLQE